MTGILILRSTGATCYPLSDGQYLMCGTAKDGEPCATVTTVYAPESLDELTEFDLTMGVLSVDTLLEHLRQAGERIAEMEWVEVQ